MAPLFALALLVTSFAWTSGPAASRSGTTCWQKRAFYQARNPGLKETLGSGTRYSAPCVLDAYLAIEQAAVEFGVEQFIDAMIRIAACESLLQPAIVGYTDPFDVGLFQWNDRPPWRWWTSARRAINTAQDQMARTSDGRYSPRYASNDRADPYNAARVAAWQIRTFPAAGRRPGTAKADTTPRPAGCADLSNDLGCPTPSGLSIPRRSGHLR